MRRTARAIVIGVDGRLLLIKRTKPGMPPYWTTPGGGVEPEDASTEDALLRELREEVGAEVGALQQVLLLATPTYDGVAAQRIFVCRLVRMDHASATGTELQDPDRGRYEIEWVPVDEDSGVSVDLRPPALKQYIEANWLALTDAVSSRRELDCRDPRGAGLRWSSESALYSATTATSDALAGRVREAGTSGDALASQRRWL